MGCIKLSILDEQYKSTEINVSYRREKLTSNFCGVDAGKYLLHGQVISEYRQDWKLDTIPRYLFNAKEVDAESGLYYYEARHYDPLYAIFTSRDLLFEKLFWISGYSYCNNNPVKYVDPTGMLAGDPDRPFGKPNNPPSASTTRKPQTQPTTQPTTQGTRMATVTAKIVVMKQKFEKLQKEVASEAARGTVNTLLFLGGIPQIIAGNIANGINGNGDATTYPKSWGIPYQFDKNWEFQRKDTWMGFGATGDVSTQDAIEALTNTGTTILSGFPFAQSGSAVGNFITNTAISTTASTATNMTIDAAQNANNNSNNTTNTNSSNSNNQNTDVEK